MAQADVDRRLGSCLISYKDAIVHELNKQYFQQQQQQQEDLTFIPELMYSLLHFLKRILQRDSPELLHADIDTCYCKEAIDIRYNFVLDLDTLVSDYVRKRMDVQDCCEAIMSEDAKECLLIRLQKKYHFLCAVTHGVFSFYDRQQGCLYMKV